LKRRSPRVDPGVRVRLYRGKTASGEALEVKSDEKGQFSLSLPDGDWCVVDGRREHLPGTKPPKGADPKCWAEAAAGCESALEDRVEAQGAADARAALRQALRLAVGLRWTQSAAAVVRRRRRKITWAENVPDSGTNSARMISATPSGPSFPRACRLGWLGRFDGFSHGAVLDLGDCRRSTACRWLGAAALQVRSSPA